MKILYLFLNEKIYILKKNSLCPGKTDTQLPINYRMWDIYNTSLIYLIYNLPYF